MLTKFTQNQLLRKRLFEADKNCDTFIKSKKQIKNIWIVEAAISIRNGVLTSKISVWEWSSSRRRTPKQVSWKIIKKSALRESNWGISWAERAKEIRRKRTMWSLKSEEVPYSGLLSPIRRMRLLQPFIVDEEEEWVCRVKESLVGFYRSKTLFHLQRLNPNKLPKLNQRWCSVVVLFSVLFHF